MAISQQTEDRFEALRAEYRTFAKRVMIVLVILAAVQLGLGLLAIGFKAQAAERNTERIAEIEASRTADAERSCYETDKHNSATIRVLSTKLAAKTKGVVLTPAQRIQLEETKIFVILLIDALEPYRSNCNMYAHEIAPPH